MPNARSKHFLIMAGGTGGHVVPGLSVAKELIARGHSVSWMGTETGIEAELVPKAGIEIDYIKISGVRGKGVAGLLSAPFKILMAIKQALGILKQRQPKAVLGMGGFAAGPGGVAAKLMSVPLVIHEQNAKAGTTNKILSKMANKVLQAFPNAFAEDIATVVGNPVRAELCLEAKSQQGLENEKTNILVLGGSLGALAINEAMPTLFAELTENIAIWHQAGKRHIEAVEKAYTEKLAANEKADGGCDYRVAAFIDDMSEAYRWADLVICRAGAMTVSELACASKPAIFIPFPFAIDDHQTANAQWMVDAGAAILLPQQNMNTEKLKDLLKPLLADKSQLEKMAKAAQNIRITDAAAHVANVCEELAA
jgi:UDP-N-acetylglucosamine--N-acetylmuramyl-(pentapeptide) pyrophosphoryl-undecaprenol N-acetylglucosamine transferase